MSIRDTLRNFFFGHAIKGSTTPVVESKPVKSAKPKKVVKKNPPKVKEPKPKIVKTEKAPKEEVNTEIYTIGAGKGKKPVDPKKKDAKVKLPNPKQ